MRSEFLFNALVLIGDHVIRVYALRSGVKQNLEFIGRLCALEEVRSMRISLSIVYFIV